METRIRMQLERATRVAEFSRENPSDVEGYQVAVARLEERLAHATTMAKQFAGSALARKAAIATRQSLRKVIAAGLQLVTGLARAAGQEVIGTSIIIRYPGPNLNQREFVDGASLAVDTAREHQELLGRYGLPPGHLDQLSASINEFAALLAQRNESARSKVAARAELRAVTREILAVVRQLHSFNRFRFRQDPAAFAAWTTSADIRVGPRRPAETPAGQAPLALPAGGDSTPRSAG